MSSRSHRYTDTHTQTRITNRMIRNEWMNFYLEPQIKKIIFKNVNQENFTFSWLHLWNHSHYHCWLSSFLLISCIITSSSILIRCIIILPALNHSNYSFLSCDFFYIHSFETSFKIFGALILFNIICLMIVAVVVVVIVDCWLMGVLCFTIIRTIFII